MRLHLKQYTEPIFNRLADYRDQLTEHPLLVAATAGRLTRDTLEQFAFHHPIQVPESEPLAKPRIWRAAA